MDRTGEWNTGRPYDERGQVIRWGFVGCMALAFRDTSRGIDGMVHGQLGRLRADDTDMEVQALLLQAYDLGLYVHARTEDEKVALGVLSGQGPWKL